MEWVETTGKSVDEAKDRALDQLGVGSDDAEFEVVEEPRSGLFGRMRGEARVRARVKPTAVRPKQDRRQRGRNQKNGQQGGRSSKGSTRSSSTGSSKAAATSAPPSADAETTTTAESSDASTSKPKPKREKQPRPNKEKQQMEQETQESPVSPQEVGDAAVAFMSDLATAFGVEGAETALAVDGTELEVTVTGGELGLMVGPGGRTLTAIQDLARVASQRRLGDHDTRLRIDVGGYREKRRAALEKFAATVAAQVIDTGEAKALEPMSSADRKIVHDAIIEIDGVTSRSEGDDPRRRVVITPA